MRGNIIMKKMLQQLKSSSKSNLMIFLGLFLFLHAAHFSFSPFHGASRQNEHATIFIKAPNTENHQLSTPLKFDDIHHSTFIEIDNLDEEVTDDTGNDSNSSKPNQLNNQRLSFVDFDKKKSVAKSIVAFHSSIPLFILYHSWKDDLS